MVHEYHPDARARARDAEIARLAAENAALRAAAGQGGGGMGEGEQIRARLAALCAERIDWPPAPGIDTAGDRAGGWDGPYLAGTWLHVADAGRNLAEHWDECRGWYADRSDEQCRAMRDYYVAHRDLFRAEAWREGLTGELLPALQADVAALLAENAALRAALARGTTGPGEEG